jgi:hypothetical protein
MLVPAAIRVAIHEGLEASAFSRPAEGHGRISLWPKPAHHDSNAERIGQGPLSPPLARSAIADTPKGRVPRRGPSLRKPPDRRSMKAALQGRTAKC